MARLTVGSALPPRDLAAVSGEKVPIPDPRLQVHLQLRRFAGCPICNLHLRTFVTRRDELQAAGVREVIVFHSPADELRPYASEFPFALIPDPDRRLYSELGVEASPRALLDPRAFPGILRAVVSTTLGVLLGRERAPALLPHGGRLGLPADFLISPGGRVLSCKYGQHADDQWSVDELLARAAESGH